MESKAESEEGWGGGVVSKSIELSGSSGEERSGAERSEDPWRTTGQTGGTLKNIYYIIT